MNPHDVKKPILEITMGMKLLLDDPVFAKKIAAAAPEMRQLLAQIQLDQTTPDKVATAGPLCAALRVLQEGVILFEAAGNLIKAKESKTLAQLEKQKDATHRPSGARKRR